ncbi:dephospho-CoA kinase [Bdellovibrio bacteriovorus]|uniref:Dephospho-CoA kinase n=1 Tax=Bdellovibrio bacteriovorus (strain ATCC 15356 / DSM 50701 / NCIMB 9529 / HD100) TaxID=264462 RepID=COAE_BDEBA|nr:dephospho-CoA kinase [Bdellovibrio bacteriovorus]Q6MIK8.1 RecName: Full=Dephospho-CoA kinase; AltName: Full=Dephosphocoenzyme A kinase [Bdellovibrio bacteriovorus HD100]CAE80905.1 coaE [Bdellovibrio bacteriovorus HD100]
MKWIGLTGGIACGKSTVSRMLRTHDIPVVDADEIAKEVVKPGSAGLKSVIQEFGPEFLTADGALDRRKLGQKVFGHPELLHKLEAITHPLIREETRRRRRLYEDMGHKLAIYDIPLLFETRAKDQFDGVIVVACTKEQQKERLRRQNWSEDEIEMRIASQIPIQFKEQQADFVLHNNRDEQHLLREVDRVLKWLEELKNQN